MTPLVRFFFAQHQPEILRTPHERFDSLPMEDLGYDFNHQYVDLPIGAEQRRPRIHFIEAGPRDAENVVLLAHGELTWSFMFRRIIPFFTHANYRVVAFDFLGFGQSDKFSSPENYTFAIHVATMTRVIEHLK